MTEKNELIQELFDRAILMKGVERQHFVDALDGETGEKVAALLAANDGIASELKRLNANAFTPTNIVPELTGDNDGEFSDLCSGQQCGNYRIVRLISSGGMGAVYLADQTAPVRRRVALKLIKLGMDSREILARFEIEKQTLALMSHQNIAAVFDGGLLENGRPFFAMEYVDGQPITACGDGNSIALEETLGRFIQACRGVEHAHQRGILHRDLKPSNIMQTDAGGEWIVKVIDFGLAKALGKSITEHSAQTRTGQAMGTPEYMSPEQAAFVNGDIDVRTDVYSLGIILFELLTGSTPMSRTRSKTRSWEDLIRAIQEDESPRPSSRILEDSRANNSSPSTRLSRQQLNSVSRELDWIVLKAIEKQRDRRYETVAALRRDIERFLNNEPIEAKPPSVFYRTRKYVTRNRNILLPVGALLLAGVFALSFMTLRERLHERNSQIALERFLHSATLDDEESTLTELATYASLLEPELRRVVQEGSLKQQVEFAALERLRALKALNYLGLESRDIIAEFEDTRDDGIISELLSTAKSSSKEHKERRRRRFSAALKNGNVRLAAVHAMMALHAGDPTLYTEICGIANSTDTVHAILDTYTLWHGDVERIVNLLELPQPEHVRWLSLLCLGYHKDRIADDSLQTVKYCIRNLSGTDKTFRESSKIGEQFGRVASAVRWCANQYDIEDAKLYLSRPGLAPAEYVNSIGISMIDVAYSPVENERFLYPEGAVTLRVSATEVSIAQYMPFAVLANRQFDENYGTDIGIEQGWTGADPLWAKGDDHPVQQVSFFDAMALCNWLSRREGFEGPYKREGDVWSWNPNADGYRLPTEPEWEFFCDARNDSGYCWGTETEWARTYAVFGEASTFPIGSRMPNSLGLQDVQGNVWEWVWGHKDAYPATSGDFANVLIPIEHQGVAIFRGGGASHAVQLCHISDRRFGNSSNRANNIGIRLVRTVKP